MPRADRHKTHVATLLALCVGAGAAHAVDGSWLAAPVDNNWNNAANWSSNPTIPDGTATFGASSRTAITFSAATSIGAIQFNAGAPAYSYSYNSLSITGPGIVNSSASTPVLAPTASPTVASLNFRNASSAGNAVIDNQGFPLPGRTVDFFNSSTAAEATINNHAGSNFQSAVVTFHDASTAGNATISNRGSFRSTASIVFMDTSSAGSARIDSIGVVDNGGRIGDPFIIFMGASTAADAVISAAVNTRVWFLDTSSAGNATVHVLQHGAAFFGDTSSGGTARFIVDADGSFAIGGLTSSGTTVGSIEGAGFFGLGAKTLTTGSSNLSTEVSGRVSDGGDGGSLTKVGSGTLILSGLYGFANLTVSSGTVQLGNGGTVPLFGDGSGPSVGAVVNHATLAINYANAFSFGAPISGTGALQQNGTGVTTLTGSNTYTGATGVNAGTLQAGATNVFSPSSAFTVASGATLDLAGFNQTIGSLAGAGAVGLGAGVLTTGGDNSSTTFAGVASGSGGLTKAGIGTSTLAGSNTYTGATTVNAGTLRAGGTNVFSPSSAFTVASGATLDLAGFNQTIGSLAGAGAVGLGAGVLTTGSDNSSTSFAGVASGSGGLTKTGTGTFTLTGSNTYTGTTTVNAGTLSVNGAIAGPVTVNSGATLGGTGSIGSTTVNNGGVFAPGNSIGAITVNGNLVLGAGSIYRVEISPTSSDRTNVTGSATLGGTAQLVFGPGSYTPHSYTILSAAGGRIGTFETVAVEGLPATLTASLSYTSTDVLLATLTSQIEPVLPKFLPGVTSNQRSVAAAQDQAFNATLPSITALYNLPLAQLPAALDALSGEVHASTVGVLADESLYARSAILGRLRQASYGGQSSMASLATGGPQLAFADEAIDTALAYAKSPIVSKAPLKAPEASRDVVFWAQGFGAWGRFDGDGNAASVRRDLAGFITGLDTRVGASGRAGIAAGYTGSKNALDGRGSANVETGHVAAYGGWSLGALNLRAGGAYAFHSIDTDRTVLFPGFADRLTARLDGGTGQVFGEVGYGVAFGNVAVEPFAGGAWVRVDTDGTTERGGAASLTVSSNRFEVGYSTLGIRAAGLVPIGDGMVLIPRAAAAWQHAFDGVTPQARLAFAASGVPFTIGGVPIARDALLAEAGVDLAIGRNATLGVSYTGQLARNVRDHAARGRFSWKF